MFFLPKCPKRHEFLCPDFESKGTCEKPRCKLPHKTKMEPKTGMKVRESVNSYINVSESDDINSSERYFYGKDSSTANHKPNRCNISETSVPIPTSLRDAQTSVQGSNEVEQLIPSRPKLGVLPSFIPIEKDGI